ncbi:hypothetical protein CYLTODRAFT_459264 [Cylindrobasidium torrendii FP15055 ss-10]|uniref:Tet-like 2OG-Fe(II) oxygenase domain-containing protein n=1 Tax=Cylindrobasidium torrendii FP15055 ss-10 TaxID=1314674 RepID=A0A0D7AUQ7_9AGAR|nr:hypothetical protein CYLTODRAFT_459264 [Cylindrobasidium torrendii FP15055 ss-10]
MSLPQADATGSRADWIANLAYPDRRKTLPEWVFLVFTAFGVTDGFSTPETFAKRLYARLMYHRRQQEAALAEAAKGAAEAEAAALKAAAAASAHLPVRATQMSDKALGDLIGNEVVLYDLRRHPPTFGRIQARQGIHRQPLHSGMEELKAFTWVSDPGVTYGIVGEGEVPVGIRITPWEEVTARQRRAMETLMEWSTLTQSIKNNAAAKGGSVKDRTFRSQGQMFGLGWHLAQQENKSVGRYAPLEGKMQRMLELEKDGSLAVVEEEYMSALGSFMPGPQQKLKAAAERWSVPSFANTEWTGEITDYVGANSLTITRGGFANALHVDNDFCSVAYGWWWVGEELYVPASEGGDGKRRRFRLNPAFDHDLISGGEFVWGEFNIGVKFERVKGLVEIMWRGSEDVHGTLMAKEPVGCTRFGTSIQLTKKGVSGILAARDHPRPAVRVAHAHHYKG